MESTGLVSEFLSPESTVTTLLSSSGHLKSSLLPPGYNSSFRYRDKEYDSASAALDAYITDYDRHRENSDSLTGKLVLPLSPPSTPCRPKVSTLRNKDVLRERLTDQELDYLNLPVSSLHHRSNRDRLSMTTDELLSIPNDGSMPVTHTSAFIHGLMSRSGAAHPCPSTSRAGHRAWDRLSSSHATPLLNLHHPHPHPTRVPRSSRCGGGLGAANPDISSNSSFSSAHRAAAAARLERAEPNPSFHLPRWFTSNKADMDCSGITSVPDLKYPAWIQRFDLNEPPPPPPPESELWDDHGVLPTTAPRTSAPSWVAELDEDDPDLTASQVDSQQTLKELRLQFAEQISLLAAERTGSDFKECLYRDNRIESLIQKADQVLNSLSQSSGGAESHAEPDETRTQPRHKVKGYTEELPHCSPSHGLSFTHDAAAEGVTEALTDRGAQAQGCGFHGSSSTRKQPGPVEALKQMLFRLQAVEVELQRQQQPPVLPTFHGSLRTEETLVKQRPEGEGEMENCPGGPSLQRALHHLSRLKLLVGEPEEKYREDEEDKEEDEGRYSSSSADRIPCIQQKPSSE